jgi:hypothetical protein
MKRSIASIEPRGVKIRQKWNKKASVEYFCNFKDCKGHKNKLDVHTFAQLSALQHETTKFGFILGTHAKYPYRWMLVSVIPSQDYQNLI